MQARQLTDNLSSVVEGLLADFLATERQRRAADHDIATATAKTWNRFSVEHGSLADEFSPR